MADRALKKIKVRKASNCSKYCIGVNLIGGVTKNNNFLETIKRVRKNIVIKPDAAAAYRSSQELRSSLGADS